MYTPKFDDNNNISLHRRLFTAAEKDAEALKSIVESGYVSIKIVNSLGQSLAHIAAKSGNLEALKYILEKESQLAHDKDYSNCSILQLAVIRGSLDAVKYLVEVHRVDISYLGGIYKDRTAVHNAVEFNRLEILKYFVEEQQVDVDCPHHKQVVPPIFMAIRRRNWDVIKYLVEERSVDVKATNRKNKENILFVIVRENALNIMEYLLDERNIDLNVDWKNYYGETPVHIATSYGRLEMLEYLVDKKFADVNVQKRTDKRTPLHYAASRDMYDICKFLIERGADPRLTDTQGDIAADKAEVADLIDYLATAAAAKRTPRSVASSTDFVAQPAPLASLQTTPSRSAEHRSKLVARAEAHQTFPRSSVHSSYFQEFLFLAKLLLNNSKTERRTENPTIFYSSPSSIIRSKMSSIAMDVLDSKNNFG